VSLARAASPALLAKLGELTRRASLGMSLGLDRVRDALAALGDPHRGLAAVHIAGSNGKGSTAAMVEAIARAAGLRTGLYTSPHLCRFAERIRINGAPIEDDSFDGALALVLSRCRPDLTFFESLTLAAFCAFREAKVELAVLEVGLGGRLDATNVIEAPLATAITSISLEHTAILGDTIEAIAREKAGILKPLAPVVLGPLAPEADQTIAEIAERVGASPIERVRWGGAPEPHVLRVGWDRFNTEIRGPGERDNVRVGLGLPGPHQAQNAGVAVGVARHLKARWPRVDWEGAIRKGLRRVHWPGRLESLERDGAEVILDCAHNPEGIEQLKRSIQEARFGFGRRESSRTALVFGALADKRWSDMLSGIAQLAERRYYTEPKGRAPAPLAELSSIAPGEAVPEPRDAIARALAESQPGDTIIVAGSIYLVGEIRAALLGIETDPVIAL
jgi:dihydrofolate synthase / folylpolyglutamate synthase